jgi:hypothetical protein
MTDIADALERIQRDLDRVYLENQILLLRLEILSLRLSSRRGR